MIIYMITNKVNGKHYIGQTIGKLSRRWCGHKSEAFRRKGKLPINCAIRKYGIENFTIEEIWECSSKEDMDVREEAFIKCWNSLVGEWGYNILPSAKVVREYMVLIKQPKEVACKIRSDRRKKDWESLTEEGRKQRVSKLLGYGYSARFGVGRQSPFFIEIDKVPVLEKIKLGWCLHDIAVSVGMSRPGLNYKIRSWGKSYLDLRLEYGFPPGIPKKSSKNRVVPVGA